MPKTNEEIKLESQKVALEILKLTIAQEDKKLNHNAKLTAKLNAIATDIIALGKDAGKEHGNAGISYNYLTGDKIFTNIKPLMKEHGVDIDPSLVPGTFKVELMTYEHTKKGWKGAADIKTNKREYQVSGVLEYTISDTETGFSFKSQWPFVGTQYDDPAKAYGTALTYADKYYFLKRFHIATDKDDADAKVVKKQREEDKKKDNTAKDNDPKPFSVRAEELTPLFKSYALMNGFAPADKKTAQIAFYELIYKETNTPPSSAKKPTEIITTQKQFDAIKAKCAAN